jgi:uncharacterized membrane protein YedE/YeeE
MNEFTSLTHQVLWAFFAIAFVVGAISQKTHFCTMGAIADVVNMGDWTRARQWILAVGLAMLGFAALSYSGQIDPSKTLYASNKLLILSAPIGGLMFGYGMVIASGCGNKTLVRAGAGNLKSWVVLLVLSVSAFATLKGITAVARVNWLDSVFIEQTQSVPTEAGFVLGALLVLAVLRHKTFWTLENFVAGAGIGVLIVLAWWVSGHWGFVPEHPETLEPVFVATGSGRMEALSFVSPTAQSLDWILFFSDKSKVLTVGIMSVLGVMVGSGVMAWHQKTFRIEGFADADDLAQHLLGAVLMGVGGVTAMGCTFGQGLSGISTLSLNSALAFAAIVVGAVISMRHQMARLERRLD